MNTSLGEDRAGLYVSCDSVFNLYELVFVLFSSSWCRVLTAACDCGAPWTFHLIFLCRLVSFVFMLLKFYLYSPGLSFSCGHVVWILFALISYSGEYGFFCAAYCFRSHVLSRFVLLV